MEQIANFLTECFHDGKGYSTLNTYRSALSVTLGAITEYKGSIGSHPLISRLLKGVYILKTPTPRYSHTWSVGKVTDYLQTLDPVRDLSLKSLTLKTVMLCALHSPQRAQTFCALDLAHMSNNNGVVQFDIVQRLKTSRPGKPQLKVNFSPSEDKAVCPVTTLNEYISRTSPLRLSSTKLFLSFVKPHKPVSTATIARWIKSVLESSGIDTSVFKAHSVRGAATSHAFHSGMPLADILKLADWSNERTFRKHYLRVPDAAQN